MQAKYEQARSFASTGRWRSYLSPREFPHLASILLTPEAWNDFWSANIGLDDIPHFTQSNLRCMFLAELVVDGYQSTHACPGALENISTTLDQVDAYAVPIDQMFYVIEPLEDMASLNSVENNDDDESQCSESIATRAPFQFLTDMVGDNTLLRKPIITEKSPTFALFEKVLLDLKNYTAHSFPFLNRVSKKDAPDYYDIIKSPMDLGTMTKKLKNMQYSSKKDFADDLNLIWSNCMIYNSHPDNVYRKHGSAMRKRSVELLRKIPDDRGLGDDSDSDEDHFFAEEETDSRRNSVTPSLVDSDKFLQEPEVAVNVLDTGEVKEDCFARDKSLEPVFFRKWSDLTRKTRLRIQKQRRDTNILQRSLLPDSMDMCLYQLGKDLCLKRDLLRQDISLSSVGKLVKDSVLESHAVTKNHTFTLDYYTKESPSDSGILEFFFPELFTRGANIPSIPDAPVYTVAGHCIGTADLFKGQLPRELFSSLSDFVSLHPDSNSCLNRMMFQNISELKLIKEYYARIVAKETKFPEELLGIVEKPKNYIAPVSFGGSLDLNDESSGSILCRAVAVILAHTGFDGRSMHEYCDNSAEAVDYQDALMHSLLENGLSDISQLEFYLRHDVQQHGAKLSDLSFRLRSAYEDIDLMPESESIEIDKHTEKVVNGTLFEDLGIDLLGLKDIEGLNVSSIPSEVWNRTSNRSRRARVRRRVLQEAHIEDPVEYLYSGEIDLKEDWPPIVPEQQINLLKEFYTKRVSAGDIEEDEAKPKNKASRSKTNLKVAQLGKKRAAMESELKLRKKRIAPSTTSIEKEKKRRIKEEKKRKSLKEGSKPVVT
ncbi:MAG: hypothetical protein SGCHY_001569 [Lobulomycetales sp.]